MTRFIVGAALSAMIAAAAFAQGGFRTPTTTCTANNNICHGDCDNRLRSSPDLAACHASCDGRQEQCLQTGTYQWRSVPPQTGLRRE
jgi:hypothetical protein